jgi:1,4-dihydroxy-2-naphthoyl-CoA hydrolase
VLHGGALMGVADSAGAVCAYLNLPAGAATSTISSSTVFLAGVRSGVVRATTRPLHVGRRVITVRTALEAEGRLVAEVTQAQAVLQPEAAGSGRG